MMPQKMKGVRVDAEGFNHRPVSVMSVIARFSGYALMLLISAFIVLPFVWMFLSSVKDNNEIYIRGSRAMVSEDMALGALSADMVQGRHVALAA